MNNKIALLYRLAFDFLIKYQKPIKYSAFFGAGTGAGFGLFAGAISELTNYGGHDLHILRDSAKIAATGALISSGAATTACLAHQTSQQLFKTAMPILERFVKKNKPSYHGVRDGAIMTAGSTLLFSGAFAAKYLADQKIGQLPKKTDKPILDEIVTDHEEEGKKTFLKIN